MMNDMFDSGKIFLVKKPISGRYGLPKMMAQFLVGAFGINACDGEIEETYVVLTTTTDLPIPRRIPRVIHSHPSASGCE